MALAGIIGIRYEVSLRPGREWLLLRMHWRSFGNSPQIAYTIIALGYGTAWQKTTAAQSGQTKQAQQVALRRYRTRQDLPVQRDFATSTFTSPQLIRPNRVPRVGCNASHSVLLSTQNLLVVCLNIFSLSRPLIPSAEGTTSVRISIESYCSARAWKDFRASLRFIRENNIVVSFKITINIQFIRTFFEYTPFEP